MGNQPFTRLQTITSRRIFLKRLAALCAVMLSWVMLGCRPRSASRQDARSTSSSAPTPTFADSLSPTTSQVATEATVAIVRGSAVDAMVERALELLSFSTPKTAGADVLIKPDLNISPDRITAEPAGLVTDARIVAALTEKFLAAGAASIIIGSRITSGSADELFERFGYMDLAAETGALLVNLADSEMVKIERREAKRFQVLDLPKDLVDADLLVNVPVLKTHVSTMVGLGLANLLELPGGDPLEVDGEDGELSDLATEIALRKASDLIIIDGLVGMEGDGPEHGEPVPMNLIVASEDIVAADTVAASIMGFDAADLDITKKASDAGLGTGTLNLIDVRGEKLGRVRREFKKPSTAGE